VIAKIRRLATESPVRGERDAALAALRRFNAPISDTRPSQSSVMITCASRIDRTLAREVVEFTGVEAWVKRNRSVRGRGRKRRVVTRLDQQVKLTGNAEMVAAAEIIYRNLRGAMKRAADSAATGVICGAFADQIKARQKDDDGGESTLNEDEMTAFQAGMDIGNRNRPGGEPKLLECV